MNRFEQIEGEWCWRNANGVLIYSVGPWNDWSRLLMDVSFMEFIRPETEQFAQYLFAPHFCFGEDDLRHVDVKYRNPTTHAVEIEVRINMQTGEKTIECESYSEHRWDSLADCMRHYRENFNEWAEIKNMRENVSKMHDKFAALEAENAKMAAEIEALRNENTELKYRPGGPGYEEAAAHFTALAN